MDSIAASRDMRSSDVRDGDVCHGGDHLEVSSETV
jgi:hypothetical protein